MWFFAHFGVGLGAARLAEAASTIGRPRVIAAPGIHVRSRPTPDYLVLGAASVLPDVDKLIGLVLFGSLERGIFHTLLAPTLAAGAGLLLWRRRQDSRLLQAAAAWYLHLGLDSMWANPRVLLWPLRGMAIARGDMTLPAFLAHWRHSLGGDPGQYVPELAGAVLVAALGLWWWRRSRATR